MITSSLFFDKGLFSVENNSSYGNEQDLSPWGNQSRNIALFSDRNLQKNQKAVKEKKSKLAQIAEQALSKQPSKKKEDKKAQQVKEKVLARSKQKIVVLLTIRDKNKSIHSSPDPILPIKIQKQAQVKKKSSFFPQINMSEYYRLKSKSHNYGSYATIDELVTRRPSKNRYAREKSQQAIKKHQQSQVPNFQLLPQINKSMQLKPIVSSKFVFAAGRNLQRSFMDSSSVTFEF